MVPAFLQYLKDNHYRVVHLVPATPGPKVSPKPEVKPDLKPEAAHAKATP
jgi:hypothetical protein